MNYVKHYNSINKVTEEEQKFVRKQANPQAKCKWSDEDWKENVSEMSSIWLDTHINIDINKQNSIRHVILLNKYIGVLFSSKSRWGWNRTRTCEKSVIPIW